MIEPFKKAENYLIYNDNENIIQYNNIINTDLIDDFIE